MAQKKVTQEIVFEEVVARGCGLDVHKKAIVATVAGTDIESETHTFQSTTRSLTELKEWLLELGITHVAMESTGVYWKPVMNILEPRWVFNTGRQCPSHQVCDGTQDRQARLRVDMQAAACRTSEREFRSGPQSTGFMGPAPYRRQLVQQQSAEHNRMIRIFEEANLKLSSVFSNIPGKTCTAVIDAIIAGETNPEILACMCTHWKLKATRQEITDAVEGCFTEHHKFMIHAIRTSITNIEAEIDHIDREIERRMEPFDAQITRLCEIPGMNTTSVMELLAEIGVDMEVFSSAEHLTSWVGLAPGNNESAGKKVHTPTTATKPQKQ